MPDNFNDTLDDIKASLQAAEHHYAESENTGSVTYAEREMQRANAIYTRTAAMTAVFQTEVLLVIADSLSRIADALEAADDRDGLAESVAIWGTGQ